MTSGNSGDSELITAGFPVPERSPIVVVDDEAGVRNLLARALGSEGYPVDAFDSGHEALQRIGEGGVALLISDIRMPGMDGIDLARQALEEDPDLAILVLTGAAEVESAVESLRLGVHDYLQKPISVDKLVEAVGRALRRRSQALYRHQFEARLRAEVEKRTDQLRRQTEKIQEVSLATLTALTRAMEAKDPYLKGHSQRVAGLSVKMAMHLGLEPAEVEEVRLAGLLHDIGMIAVRESVLHTKGDLSDEEYAHVQAHVETGASILQPLPNLGDAVQFIRCHHERLDGSGYPRGLRGPDIPLGAQIVGLAEVVVSLTEDRAHRAAYALGEALERLEAMKDVWFDARVVEAMRAVVDSG